MTELAADTIIDSRYRVLEKIGAGGMADVYCAEDTHLGRKVAVKLLHSRFAQDQEFVERFRREASSAAGLQHPNVVGVYDRGEFDDTYYIAMEYCEGESLRDRLRGGPLPTDDVRRVALQVADALAAAHRRGIVHRDVKPGNIVIGADGTLMSTTSTFPVARRMPGLFNAGPTPEEGH